jgi:iron(II)-dependent oxidoreductase
MAEAASAIDCDVLCSWVRDARQRTLELIDDLSDEQLLGPHLSIINPLLWEIGHVTWFHERWILRHVAGQTPPRTDADVLYDSAAVAHDTRWDLLLPPREQTLAYMRDVHDRVLDRLSSDVFSDDLRYFVMLSVFHEDMHTEAFTYTRQTLAYPAPRLSLPEEMDTTSQLMPPIRETNAVLGDAFIPGGQFMLGATPDELFIFDNEKWAHSVKLAPFAISRTAVTQQEFAAFVDDRGYERRELWSDAGWTWRVQADATHPIHWQRESNGRWLRRDFDRWLPLEPHRPVLHVNFYEADAYCRWARRRLPTEVEWEAAAAMSNSADSRGTSLAASKRRFPWGDDPPTPQRANLDWRAMETVDVTELSDGDSAAGCRQMIGNVWEWTADDFLPYPGFVIDPYKEYSQPWFGTHKVLRGGCWVTRSRLLRNTWRNFYTPDRRDIWAGFRTCALKV